MVFQLWSHSHLYGDHHNKKSKKHTGPFTTLRNKEKARPAHQTGGSNMSTYSFPLSNFSPVRQPTPSPLAMHPSEQNIAEGSTYDLTTLYTGGCAMSREPSSLSGSSSTSTRIGSEDSFTEEVVTPKKEPRVSWFLTILVLVLVTVVCPLSP